MEQTSEEAETRESKIKYDDDINNIPSETKILVKTTLEMSQQLNANKTENNEQDYLEIKNLISDIKPEPKWDNFHSEYPRDNLENKYNVMKNENYTLDCPFTNIIPEQTRALIKLETSESTAKLDQLDVGLNEQQKIETEEIVIKNEEDNLMFTNIIPEQTQAMLKLKTSKSTAKSEQLDVCQYEELKIENEDIDIKNEEDELITVPNQNTEEVSKSTCDQCDLQTIYKPNLKSHILQCDQCTFQTLYKNSLNLHLTRHKTPSEASKLTCDHCEYATVHKENFKSHLLKHRNVKEVAKFKCGQCDYTTSHNGSLKSHLIIHKDFKEAVWFECGKCEYATVHKGNLKSHMEKHKDPAELTRYKCDQCEFTAVRKDQLKFHLIIKHKNPQEVLKFKCDQCKYTTVRKSNMKVHILKHEDPERKSKFKCSQCSFQSIYISSIRKHLKRHTNCENPKEEIKFKCDYVSDRKTYLKFHVLKKT